MARQSCTSRLAQGLALLLATSPSATALQQAADVTVVKAAFLFNFAQFVEWPESKGTFVFCVVGEIPIAEALAQQTEGQRLGARAIRVRNGPPAGELQSCNLIYLGRSQKRLAESIGSSLAGKQVLLVSEFLELGDRGVPINFFLSDERVRFEINMAAVGLSGLKISSRLLRLARIAGQSN